MRARTRLTAIITGKAREVGPAAAHEKTVLAITRRIHKKEQQLREASATVKRLRKELRADRRELRVILQRSSEFTTEQLEVAGNADAVDAVNARLEQPAPAPRELTEAEATEQIAAVLGTDRPLTAREQEDVDEFLGGAK